MKKLVSIRELKEYYAVNKPHNVLFHTENQDWYEAADPCKLRMSFPIMLINENPNLIFLVSGTNILAIDRVQCAEIDTGSTVLGTVLRVYCGAFGSSSHDMTYTLIVA